MQLISIYFVNFTNLLNQVLHKTSETIILDAAGNFLCPVAGLSYNAYKTVLDIDTVGTFNTSKIAYQKYLRVRYVFQILPQFCKKKILKNHKKTEDPDKMFWHGCFPIGSWRCFVNISVTLHYRGGILQAHAASAKAAIGISLLI